MERKVTQPVLELRLNSISFKSGNFMPLITIESESVGELLSRCDEEGFFKDESRFISGAKFSGQVTNVGYGVNVRANQGVFLTYKDCRTLRFPKAINEEVSYSVKS